MSTCAVVVEGHRKATGADRSRARNPGLETTSRAVADRESPAQAWITPVTTGCRDGRIGDSGDHRLFAPLLNLSRTAQALTNPNPSP